jgi:hypothetical protein
LFLICDPKALAKLLLFAIFFEFALFFQKFPKIHHKKGLVGGDAQVHLIELISEG